MNFKYFSILICMFFFSKTQAQLCTGSLGDPVVKIDFGSGTAIHGSALGTDITSYTYTSANFPSDGSYTVESTTNTPGTWWTTTDHTGGGYMMVVNASFSTTDYFYKNTVTGLCPDTTYEFAAWVMNLLRSNDTSPPDITFTIESTTGTILGTYSTGSIPLNSSAVWKQYGLFFTTPAGVSTVVIRMRNNKAGAAPGNDIALDDITFRACGPTVTSAIQNDSSTSLDICQNDTKTYTLTGTVSSGYSNPAYQWQSSSDNGTTWTDISGANSIDYTFVPSSVAGTYLYRIAVAQNANIASTSCRVVSNLITFKVGESPVAPAFTTVQPTCELPSGTINVTTSSNTTYSIDGTNYQASGVFSGLAGGDYNVTAKSVSGCISAAQIAHINSVASSNATPTFSVIQPVICVNPFGTITITSLDFEYSFDNGLTWSTNNVKSGLVAGDYWLKTRNSSNCETIAILATVLVPPGYPPTPTVTVTQPDCLTLTGTITVLDVAAEYSFDNGLTWTTSNSKNNLIPATYKVLIKNALGCVSLVANEVEIKAYINTELLPVATTPQLFCVQQNATLNDIAITGVKIKWYDAPVNGNLLPNSTILQTGIYYATQTATICESERIPVEINIQNTPAPTGNSLQDFCTTQKPTIASLVVSGIIIVWYDSATNGTLVPATTALGNGVTYYASQTVNGCESVNRLPVSVSIVSPSIPVKDVSDFICDDKNDGSELVDLTSYQSQITSNTTVNYTYFSSKSGAENQTTAEQITALTNYNLSLETNVIYARIDSNDKCYQVVQLSLTLVSEPVIPISDIVSLCQNENVTIDAGSGFDSYLWSTGETSQSIIVAAAGSYSVMVTQNHGTTICSSTKDFLVQLSNAATIAKIETQDWTDAENVITVELADTSLGNYEYSLDGITYQDSNTFSGLLSGDYTVYVRDKNGCGTVNQEVFLLNYPKYFTPNQDGYNDTWAVKFSASEPGLITKIFDRYGKLLKEFGATSAWDGTYNGHELPSTDYWFVVTRANGKVYKGHFAMKR
ncbi:T9SS type B sorting domain-containing protein [Flavobacterium alvei]|uniref:T9SS type B sorting domain-containing protein n=1 Tax=Flavobacterium alvei TaxID=2080416 RepID=UPI0026F0A6D6|nr:T9SS type B sorting domain-containing protein [Flavobacterium alvei]